MKGNSIYKKGLPLFLAAALLGPLLIVDSGFKSQLGRARPAQTEVFGGPLRFTPAFLPSDQCQRTCCHFIRQCTGR